MREGRRKIENFLLELLMNLSHCHKCIFLELPFSMMDKIVFSGKHMHHSLSGFVCKIFRHRTIESFELCTILLGVEYLKRIPGYLIHLARNENTA